MRRFNRRSWPRRSSNRPETDCRIVLRTLSVTSNSPTFFVANSQPCRSLVDCVTDGCVSSPCARIAASCAEADGPRGSGYTHKHEDALKELMSLGFSDLYRATYPDPTKHPGHTRDYSRINPKVTAMVDMMVTPGQWVSSLVVSRQKRPRPV